MPVVLFAMLVVAGFTLPGIALHYWEHGGLNPAYCILALFFSINLLICYWEICLVLRRDHIADRAEHWRKRQRETGCTPGMEFLTSRVPLRDLLSARLWGDLWSAYSVYDGSYGDHRTYGFNVDMGNGFFTPIPTLLLYAAFTVDFMPAVYAGILGIALFWQWAYITSLYWVSFHTAGRRRQIGRRYLYYAYVVAPNSIWILLPLLGLYVSIRLIVDGHYGILGH